ncbi:uncharacterized protein AB7M35_003751 [Amorphus suaedae]
MGHLFRIGLLAAALMATMPAAVQAASFDCAKAASRTEKTICGDATLSGLDGDLGTAYRDLMGRIDFDDALVALLKKSQRDWIKTRDACADAACMASAYRSRIAEIEGRSSPEDGDYAMGDVALFVRDLGPKLRIVAVSGGNVRWVCTYSGVAKPIGAHRFSVGDENMTVTFAKDIATVDDTEANRAIEQDYCGMNGHMLGDYDRE